MCEITVSERNKTEMCCKDCGCRPKKIRRVCVKAIGNKEQNDVIPI